MSDSNQAAVLFVCLGNICRSPTAHGIFEHKVAHSPLRGRVTVESAGTGDWHLGNPPDARAQQAARERGYALEHLRARQVNEDDFHRFDWILAMDHQNLSHLEALNPAHSRARLQLFLDLLEHPPKREVPDPYYGGGDGFADVLDLCEAASDALLQRLLVDAGAGRL